MSYFGTIYADTELPSRAKAVYMYLRDRSDAEGTLGPQLILKVQGLDGALFALVRNMRSTSLHQIVLLPSAFSSIEKSVGRKVEGRWC